MGQVVHYMGSALSMNQSCSGHIQSLAKVRTAIVAAKKPKTVGSGKPILHAPGVLNTQVDFLSGGGAVYHEWQLNPMYLNLIFRDWGMLKVFATHRNLKCEVYWVRGGMDPTSLGDLSWTNRFLSMFPLIPLIPKVLLKI